MSIRKGDSLIAGSYSISDVTEVDYSTRITDKPQINSIELIGNKSLEDLGAASSDELQQLSQRLGGITIAKLTQEEYDQLVSGDTVDENTMYIVTETT